MVKADLKAKGFLLGKERGDSLDRVGGLNSSSFMVDFDSQNSFL